MDESSRRRLSQAYANIDYHNQQLVDALNKYVLSQEKNLSDWDGRQFALAGELKIQQAYDKAFAKIEERIIEDLQDDDNFVEELIGLIVEMDNRKQEDVRINDKAKEEVDGLEKIIDDMTTNLKTVSDMVDTTNLPTIQEGKQATPADLKVLRQHESKLQQQLESFSKEHDEARKILQKIQSYYLGIAEHRVYQQMVMQKLTDKMQDKRYQPGGNTKIMKALHEDSYRISRECHEGARNQLDDLEDFEAESEKRLSISQSSRRERYPQT